MTGYNLATDEGLRSACQSIQDAKRATERSEWLEHVAETIRWVRVAPLAERSSRNFQQRLWEHNFIAAVGQGNIPVTRALDDPRFREWLATRSMVPLPTVSSERVHFLASLYTDLKEKLTPFIDKKVPHLKIFRVIAALYPEAMTTVGAVGSLGRLTRAMGGGRLDSVQRHVWVRERLDQVLGEAGNDPLALAERMSLAWMLYERFVQNPGDDTETTNDPVSEKSLTPLPAARRRRGLTAIRGLFPGVLSALEFVRDGVSRAELVDFLRASAPDVKETYLGTMINVLQSELGVIRSDGDRYTLTERGEDVLESQDPSHLADWLLTRILGVDAALVALRDRGQLPPTELSQTIQAMNPGWTTNFTPQSIVSWLRSMGVVETTPQNKHGLTELGKQWASRVHWIPEPLPAEPDVTLTPPPNPESSGKVKLPELPAIVAAVRKAGHFPDSLIARLHAALWSHRQRHFAVLTGLSGSGKTLLARAYAKALVPEQPEKHLFTLSVQPGWYDPSPLLGYINPIRKEDCYVQPPFLAFLRAASADPGRPYVAVLDEMNLSHPEQYMAPLLSAMETDEGIRLHGEGDYFDGVPRSLPYPPNLGFIGTVNMDETTHGLSDKILDRAFVLEFWDVDLDAYPRWGTRPIDTHVELRVREVLSGLMAALSPARLHFGWRVVDDVLDFMAQLQNAGGSLPADIAIDAVVYGKVLPKLRGEDAPRFRTAIAKCADVLASFGLTQSNAKVEELKRDLEMTGSARFWR